jgi:hypothetical protein
MLTKKLFALALVSALGLSVSAAQAQGFDHRDRGFHNSARHGEFRHGYDVRHYGHYSPHYSRFHNRFHNRFDHRFHNHR